MIKRALVQMTKVGSLLGIVSLTVMLPLLGQATGGKSAGAKKSSGQKSEKKTEQKSESHDLAELMHSFYWELSQMRPYLVSSEAFSSAEGREQVRRSLVALDKKTHGERPAEFEKTPGFRFNFSLMAYQVQNAKKVFDRGAYELARQNINATMNLCVACHTQLPDPKAKDGKTNPLPVTEPAKFENAEFLFITKRFDEALEQYDELIRKYPASGLTPDQLTSAYSRKLALFARVKRDPRQAVTNFKRDLVNKEIPADVRQNVRAWISHFEKWQREREPLEKLSTEKLLGWVKKNPPSDVRRAIAPAQPELVNALRVSGVLYEHLAREGSGAHAQEIILNVALYEKSLAPIYWYSLHDSLLRECIIRYPKKPLSRKCYEVYADDVRERYAGSPMPDEVQAGLKILERYL